MIWKRFTFAAGALAACLSFSGTASAQATRTWVSGVGDDVNPCSRTAPCKTFAGAISKTAAGGEINCLDPGGYGAVTITKSMTISCLYTGGGMLAGGNGIVVNAGPGDVVFLRGLDIFGVTPPSNGVRFVAGGALHIEESTIRRFNAPNSFGIMFAPSGTSRLYIRNTTIADNGNGATGGGIGVAPSGSGSAVALIVDSTIVNNGGSGIAANGQARVLVGGSKIFGNNMGVSAASQGSVLSYGDNLLVGNGTDGSFGQNVAKK